MNDNNYTGDSALNYVRRLLVIIAICFLALLRLFYESSNPYPQIFVSCGLAAILYPMLRAQLISLHGKIILDIQNASNQSFRLLYWWYTIGPILAVGTSWLCLYVELATVPGWYSIFVPITGDFFPKSLLISKQDSILEFLIKLLTGGALSVLFLISWVLSLAAPILIYGHRTLFLNCLIYRIKPADVWGITAATARLSDLQETLPCEISGQICSRSVQFQGLLGRYLAAVPTLEQLGSGYVIDSRSIALADATGIRLVEANQLIGPDKRGVCWWLVECSKVAL